MAGIYFHIPFCKQACHYCDFHFSTSAATLAPVMEAMHKELDKRTDYIGSEKVETIYFGGGTPSLLDADRIWKFIDHVKEKFNVADNAEITLEANPDDFSAQKLKEWQRAGVNRLSIGIQSFRNSDLELMNRAHKAVHAESAVKSAQDAGIHNLSIDLIYAIPGSGFDHWRSNVEKAIELSVPHISAYCLTFEEKTAFGHFQKTGKLKPSPDEAAAEQFLYLVERLNEAGILLYEVSNFATVGNESRHNSAYWNGKPYLGIGPSAHSFDGESRQWNVANNPIYIKSILSNTDCFEREVLNDTMRYNEWIMTGLRRREGIDSNTASERFGVNLMDVFAQHIGYQHEQGNLLIHPSSLSLTNKGMLLADGIAADFFILSP